LLKRARSAHPATAPGRGPALLRWPPDRRGRARPPRERGRPTQAGRLRRARGPLTAGTRVRLMPGRRSRCALPRSVPGLPCPSRSFCR
jgi:hypothetical protein